MGRMAAEKVSGKGGRVARLSCQHLGHSGIMIYPNPQIRLGDDRTIVLVKLVAQEQFAGIATAINNSQVQIQSATDP